MRFWVTDSGPGLPPGTEEDIFGRFARDGLAGARVGGTGAGLGLAVVRAVAEAHGGTVGVGPAPRSGATFTVELPRW